MGTNSAARARGGPAVALALALLLGSVPRAASAGLPVHLRLAAGWDGVARRGGVVPLRMTIRLPDDAPAASVPHPWCLRVSPQGGPWSWALVLPVPLAPGVTRVVDAAVPLHADDTGVSVVLVDADGVEWGRAEQTLALVPARANLGVAVGAEHGLRRVREERGAPFEITWIRLPVHELPSDPAAWLDLCRLRWEGTQQGPAPAAESAVRLWSQWTGERSDRDAPADTTRPSRAPSDPGWQAALDAFAPTSSQPGGGTKGGLALIVVGMLGVALAARPLGGPRQRRRVRGVGLAVAVCAGAWLALGAPPVAGSVVPIGSRSESIAGGLSRRWTQCRVASGVERSALPWPAADVVLIGPAWLPRGGRPWELWWWMPGAGQPRWEVRAPHRGARATWMGLALQDASTPTAAGRL